MGQGDSWLTFNTFTIHRPFQFTSLSPIAGLSFSREATAAPAFAAEAILRGSCVVRVFEVRRVVITIAYYCRPTSSITIWLRNQSATGPEKHLRAIRMKSTQMMRKRSSLRRRNDRTRTSALLRVLSRVVSNRRGQPGMARIGGCRG